MTEAAQIPHKKVSILFPPGDIITSLLFEKEKENKIQDVLARLCQLRGLSLDELQAMNEAGSPMDTSKTIGESETVFIELVEKKDQGKKKKSTNEGTDDDDLQYDVKKLKFPDAVKFTPGKPMDLPLKDQLFPHEWEALQKFKSSCDVSSKFSDDFIMACLFARKFDEARTRQLLESNLKFRKQHNMEKTPKFSDLDPGLFKVNVLTYGVRTKAGFGVLYHNISAMEPNKFPFTAENIFKYQIWQTAVGFHSMGIDIFRNGLVTVEELGTYGWKNFDFEHDKKISAAMTDTIPMRISKVFCMNAPFIFNALFKLFKVFIKGKLMDRVEPVDDKALKKSLGSEALWEKYGGDYAQTTDQCYEALKEWTQKHEARLTAHE